MFAINIEKCKKTKILYDFKKTLSLSVVYIQCGHKIWKLFKEEKLIEMLKVLDLINNVEEYQKMYKDV